MLNLVEQYFLALDAGNFDKIGEILEIAAKDEMPEDAIFEGHRKIDVVSDTPFVQQIQCEALNVNKA